MKLSQLIEMASMTRTETGMGMSQYHNADFVLAGGFRSGNSSAGKTRLKYMIYDRRIVLAGGNWEDAELGFVELFIEDGTGEIEGLVNIELKPAVRKSGYGKRLIKDIVDTTKSGLNVYDIQKEARAFWKKAGVEFYDEARRKGHIEPNSQ